MNAITARRHRPLSTLITFVLMASSTMGLRSQKSKLPQNSNKNFNEPGPFTPETTEYAFKLPSSFSDLHVSSLPVHITAPVSSKTTKYPLLLFFSGFKMYSKYYANIINHAASWGYVVVAYDFPFFKTPSVVREAALLDSLLANLKTQEHLYMIDFDTIVAAGHSRGAKLAALLFADAKTTTTTTTITSKTATKIQSLFLIDPVDCSKFAPISDQNPSGVDALVNDEKKNKIGIVGAGVLSGCNPLQYGNYIKFFNVSGHHSWELIIKGASHSTFIDTGNGVLNFALDSFCHKARNISRQDTALLASTPMIAWFYNELKGGGEEGAHAMKGFYDWVNKEREEGRIEFNVRGSDDDDDAGRVLVGGIDAVQTAIMR